MRYITLAFNEFEQFRDVHVKHRWDWPATFSCNPSGQVWPTPGYGFTNEEDRMYLSRREYPTLHTIVDAFLSVRPEGGRFHINDEGVFLAYGGPHICRFSFI